MPSRVRLSPQLSNAIHARSTLLAISSQGIEASLDRQPGNGGLAFGESFAPHRNPMPPPKLPADAPVLNVRQPMVIDLGPALRMEPHFPGDGHPLYRSATRRPDGRRRRFGGCGAMRCGDPFRSVASRQTGQASGLCHPLGSRTPCDCSTAGYFKNHCSLKRGSMGTSARWLKPTLFS